MWTFQPQIGAAAGASQDYSTKMNWFSAGPRMIQEVNNIRDERNRLLIKHSKITSTPRNVLNPRYWPSHLLSQPNTMPTSVRLPRNDIIEKTLTTNGAQIAGGAYADMAGDIYSQLRSSPRSLALRPDGIFQIGGGSSLNPTETILGLQIHSTRPRSGGIGSRQFVSEFIPTVYINPFSGPPDTYPDDFLPNYDNVDNTIAGYD